MIELNALMPAPITTPGLPAPPGSASDAFATLLAGLPAPPAGAPGRQGVADDGTDLPEQAHDKDEPDDYATEGMTAWLVGLPPAAPLPDMPRKDAPVEAAAVATAPAIADAGRQPTPNAFVDLPQTFADPPTAWLRPTAKAPSVVDLPEPLAGPDAPSTLPAPSVQQDTGPTPDATATANDAAVTTGPRLTLGNMGRRLPDFIAAPAVANVPIDSTSPSSDQRTGPIATGPLPARVDAAQLFAGTSGWSRPIAPAPAQTLDAPAPDAPMTVVSTTTGSTASSVAPGIQAPDLAAGATSSDTAQAQQSGPASSATSSAFTQAGDATRVDLAPPQPIAPAIAASIARPARQVFAAAIDALSVRPRRKLADADDLSAGTIATTDVKAAIPPASTGSLQTSLDLKQDRGLAAMIDHIEALRDGADAGDTRIRLSPDALGAVDVAVRQDGDAVHVRFTTQTEAARAAIVDAQPQLTTLAESRGLKLFNTSVETSAGGNQPQPRQQPTLPQAPARAPRATIAADGTSSTARLA